MATYLDQGGVAHVVSADQRIQRLEAELSAARALIQQLRRQLEMAESDIAAAKAKSVDRPRRLNVD